MVVEIEFFPVSNVDFRVFTQREETVEQKNKISSGMNRSNARRSEEIIATGSGIRLRTSELRVYVRLTSLQCERYPLLQQIRIVRICSHDRVSDENACNVSPRA